MLRLLAVLFLCCCLVLLLLLPRRLILQPSLLWHPPLPAAARFSFCCTFCLRCNCLSRLSRLSCLSMSWPKYVCTNNRNSMKECVSVYVCVSLCLCVRVYNRCVYCPLLLLLQLLLLLIALNCCCCCCCGSAASSRRQRCCCSYVFLRLHTNILLPVLYTHTHTHILEQPFPNCTPCRRGHVHWRRWRRR